MNRRQFLHRTSLCAAAALLPSTTTGAAPTQPILDAHIHLFDPTRAGGVPWPAPSDTVLYKPALPPRYQRLAQPFGIRGAIAIEASPLTSDNQWLLDLARNHPFIVGVIGDLVPGTPNYAADLDRLHANPLFLGFRTGNLWQRDLAQDILRPGFLDGFRALAQAGLVFETANPDNQLIHTLSKIADAIPDLRIVLDHLPNAQFPTNPEAPNMHDFYLKHLAARPNFFIKLSEIPRRANGKLITNPTAYRDSLEHIWDTFGEDRILFGSDWPNSDTTATFAETFSITRQYISTKSAQAQHKFYWQNSRNAYHWQPRTPDQHTTSESH